MNNNYLIGEALCAILDNYDADKDAVKMYESVDKLRMAINEDRIVEYVEGE